MADKLLNSFAAAPVVAHAAVSSPSASVHKVNPFASISGAVLAEFQAAQQQPSLAQSLRSPSSQHKQQTASPRFQRSALANEVHTPKFAQPFAEAQFAGLVSSEKWASPTRSSQAPASATLTAPVAASSDMCDRFPVNFDAPCASLWDTQDPSVTGEHGLSALVLGSQCPIDDDESGPLPLPLTSTKDRMCPLPTRRPVKGAVLSLEEQAYNYETFKEQMRALPCLQDLKHQVRTFVSSNMHRVVPADALVADLAKFMSHMSTKFASNEAWKNKHPSQLDNAIEGLEHFVCLNLYSVLFQPQLSDDSDRDKWLFDRAILLRFLEGKHLDLPDDCCQPAEIAAAAAHLAQMDKHKTPREKLACVAAACAVLRTMLRHPTIDREQFFLSALVLAVLRAQPRHLFSNLQFIRRFRNPAKITPNDEYCLMHMDGAVEYLDKMQPQWLSIEPAEFDASVNRSVDSLSSDGSDSVRTVVAQSASFNAVPTLTQAPTSTSTPAPAPAPYLLASAASTICAKLAALSSGKACSAPTTAQPASSASAPANSAIKPTIVTPAAAATPDPPSQITPTANESAPWRRADPATGTAVCNSELQPTAALAATLGTGWCDVAAELGVSESSGGPTAGRRGSLASLAPTVAMASACSQSSGIASDLADLDPLGHAGAAPDADALSLHSLNWGCASPAEQPPRSRTASMRSALSHHSTDVAQCHAADLMAFAPAAASVQSASSPGRTARAPQPLDPYRDGGIGQLLAAASEPPVDKFLQCSIEGLSMSDIPLLLADYKRLAALNASLSRVLRLNMQ